MMKDRWPKVCLRDEIRGIFNRNPSQRRRKFKQALGKVGDEKIVDATRVKKTSLGESRFSQI